MRLLLVSLVQHFYLFYYYLLIIIIIIIATTTTITYSTNNYNSCNCYTLQPIILPIIRTTTTSLQFVVMSGRSADSSSNSNGRINSFFMNNNNKKRFRRYLQPDDNNNNNNNTENQHDDTLQDPNMPEKSKVQQQQQEQQQQVSQKQSPQKSLQSSSSSSYVHDLNVYLIYTDIFAILIACQLMGLLDVLNDPTFYTNGGWMQPIQLLPVVASTAGSTTSSSSISTLPLLVQRITYNSILYIFVSLFLTKNYYNTTTTIKTVSLHHKNIDEDSYMNRMFQNTLSSLCIFTIVRCVLLLLCIVVIQQQPIITTEHTEQLQDNISLLVRNLISTTPIVMDGTSPTTVFSGDYYILSQFIELLRECYIIAITILSGRYTIYQFL